MNADLEHLIVLQAQDLELARLRREIAELPRRVTQAETALVSAAKALNACREAIAQEERLRRSQESEIATQRAKVDRLRRSLDAATSAAQVAAFEHEIHFAQSAIAKLEDDEFASLERTEAIETQLKTAETTLKSSENQLESERSHAAATRAGNETTIAGIQREKTALRAQITEQWLATYDRLIKAKGSAVAEALGNATAGKCAACQMTVRPQRWQDLIGRDHEDEIFICESCGRLLFWDPRRDTPKTWSAGDRLQGAQSGNAR